MAIAGLVAANNLSDIVDIEKTWDSIGSNISATVTVPSPVLDLNFASNKSLIDSASGNNLITFTRDSVGTFVNGNGILQAAASGVPRFDHNPITGESLGLLVESASTNYLLNGNALNTWATKECSVSNDGTTILGSTAWKITANSTLSNHYVSQADGNGGAQMFSVYVKRGNTRYAMVSSQGDVSITGTAARPSYYAVIDFDSKIVSDTGNFQYVQLTQVESNAYRIQFASSYAGGDLGARGLSVHPLQNTGSTWYFAGNGEYVYAAMAQNEGYNGYYSTVASSYIPTTGSSVTRAYDVATIQGSNFGTSKNLIPYPEHIEGNYGWTQFSIYYSQNATLSPFGQLTADLLRENNNYGQHAMAVGFPLASTLPHTFSVFAKANGRNDIALRVYVTGVNWVTKVFNLTGDGSITSSQSGPSADFAFTNQSIVKYDNGWYRISITTVQPSSRTVYLGIDFCTSSTPTLISNEGGAEFYVGDFAKGFYLWGAQLERSSAPTEYSPYLAVSNWFDVNTGTFFVKGLAKDIPFGMKMVSLGNDINPSIDSGNFILSRYFSGPYVAIVTSLEGDVQGGAVGIETSYPATIAVAAAFEDNSSIMAYGGAVTPKIVGRTLAKNMNVMRIGAGLNGDYGVGSTISRIAFWPTRLQDVTLKALSTSGVVSNFSYSFSIKGKDILALSNVSNASVRDFVFIKKLTAKAQQRITTASQNTILGTTRRDAAMPKTAPVTAGNYLFSTGSSLSGVTYQINGNNALSLSTSPFSGSDATVPLLLSSLKPQANWRISEAMVNGTITSPEIAIPIETNDLLLFMKAGQS
jgi:hypothetical protein